MDLTLRQRGELIKRCIPHPKPKVFEISQQRRANNTADIIEALDNAIQNRFCTLELIRVRTELNIAAHPF